MIEKLTMLVQARFLFRKMSATSKSPASTDDTTTTTTAASSSSTTSTQPFIDHTFVETTFATPHWCNYCLKVIWKNLKNFLFSIY
jgi:hypothetical protein